MSDVVEKVARAMAQADGLQIGEASDFAEWHWEEYVEPAKAAIRALAANVTDEMVNAFSRERPAHYFPLSKWGEDTRRAISAALRAVTDKGET